jgi:VanZ family protein
MNPALVPPAGRLARDAAIAYLCVILYASLHPFTGWRDHGVPVFDFVLAAWPRYWTGFDLVSNLAAYVPLGFLLVAARRRASAGWAVGRAVLLGVVLSGLLESAQNFLDSRVPSNLDWACNSLGVVVGAALGLRFGGLFADGGGLYRARRDLILPGRLGDTGLMMIALWLFTQLNPSVLLFGHGDVRSLLGLSAALPYSAEGQVAVEWGIAVLGPLAVGLTAREVMVRPAFGAILALVLVGLGVRGTAAGVILGGEQFFKWVTPGNKVGFVIGAALLLAALTLPAWLRRVVAALSLLGGTALANLAPDNPYLLGAASPTLLGHFLNFNGLTRLCSVLWPFLALAWLMVPAGGPEKSGEADPAPRP